MNSPQETRKYITPYAFRVGESLIGKALASPLRRLTGMLIDLIVVASLTLMSVTVLAGCVCIVSVIGYFKAKAQSELSFAPTALMISAVLSAVVFMGGLTLSNIDFDLGFGASKDTVVEINEESSDEDVETEGTETGKTETSEESLSFIAWIKAALNDLGLGFGWAALYFSVFVAWFNGQTFGKMLLRIKVVKLDGKNLTLWESFERYGGYSAGLATGLLGFLQIIWDPNRQAIHDKISETMVIDLRKPDQIV